MHGVFAGPAHGAHPLVVLESGAFGFSADWAAVQDKLGAAGFRSLAYDRAGLGFSDPGPEPRDSNAIVADLEAFLRRTHEDGPFILCGHSMAGLHTRLFAARNRRAVSGLVLVDATTPEAMDAKMVSGFVDQFSRFSRLAAWGAGAGLLAPLAGTGPRRRHRPGRRARLGEALGLRPRQPQQVGVQRGGTPGASRRGRRAKPALSTRSFPSPWSSPAAGAAQRPARHAVRPGAGVQARPGEQVVGASHATVLSEAYADAIVRAVEHVAKAGS